MTSDAGNASGEQQPAEGHAVSQPAPYSEFPFIALAIVAVAAMAACLVVHRHPRTGTGEGATFTGT